MRVLHVAALPFPSPQGTQGLLHAMLMAHAAAGHDAHLLCYPGSRLEVPYTVHRCAPEREVSLRSGPSFEKLALDRALAMQLPKLVRTLAPTLIIAHHVEAALIAWSLRIPAWFCAHTELGAELPTYFRDHWAPALRLAGTGVDRWLSRRMPTLAVSPWLAERLSARVLSLPWVIPAPIAPGERERARLEFALGSARVALYAGNLDRYQGLDALRDAIAREGLHWLIATESPIRAFARTLHAFMPRVRFARLRDEAARRRVYAACDFAVVPRAVPGGIPIKLFDALARGVPVVAQRSALAGYPLEPYCSVVDVWRFEPRPSDARSYLREAHAPARFAAQISDLSRPDAARA